MTIARTRLFATLALAGLLAAPAAAQTGSDRGTFTVFVGDRQVGTEEFTIEQTGTGTTATGNLRVALPEGTLQLDSRLRTRGVGADPVDYQVSVEGSAPSRTIGTVSSGRFSAKIVTPAGEQLREYVASNGAVVLDEGLAHHYYFLAQRTHGGTVPVIIPRENRQVIATVTNRGEERTRVAGTEATLFHLVVQPRGGDEQHVWVDALNRVIRVEIPARAWRAERTQLPR